MVPVLRYGHDQRAGCRQDPRWYALWSWLTSGLQVAFITTFRDGHANPSLRTPLAVLAAELGKFAYECGRVPARNDLSPKTSKPRETYMQLPRQQYGTHQPVHRPYGYGNRTSNFGCNYRPFGGRQYR